MFKPESATVAMEQAAAFAWAERVWDRSVQ